MCGNWPLAAGEHTERARRKKTMPLDVTHSAAQIPHCNLGSLPVSCDPRAPSNVRNMQ